MSVTIDSLDIQIRSSAGSAKQNIEDLAKALERLNSASKVTKIVNSLGRLNTALTALRSNSGVMGQLSSLSQALGRLASIPKLTGLQSAIRELKKLPQVMNDLDAADIAQFTLRIKALSTALAPLATQLDRIGTAFGRLPARISQIVTGTNRLTSATQAHSNALNHQSINLMAAFQNLQDYLYMINFIGDAIANLMNDAIEWDGIQARFGRAFGDSAQESLEWVDKLSEGLMINKQEFMQYSSLFAEMLSGFGVNQVDAGKMAIGYTELAYDIWAAYNDVYKSLGGEEGAIAAVRSAIAGEVEPIRRAGFTIVDSQLAATAANHGLAYSTQKATEAQKSYLRYVTLVDQAIDKNIIGVYAAEMQTAEGAVRTLSQQLRTLGQALGSLFLPILQAVVPYLTVFVQLLYDAAEAIAKFFGLPFFETNWSRGVDNSGLADFAQSADASTEALDGAADAAKKLKHYTMGFDELNIIDPSSGASGGGGAGGAGDGSGWDRMNVDSIWDESLFKQASKQVDELKQKVKDFYDEWQWQIEAISAGLTLLGLGKIIERLKEAEIFSGGFLKNMNTISKLGLSAVVITLQWTLMEQFLENFIEEGSWGEYIKAVVTAALGTWALGALWGPTGVVIGLGITTVVSLKAVFSDGSVDSMEEVVAGLTGIAAGVGAVGVAWKKVWPVLKNSDFGTLFGWLINGDDWKTVLSLMFPNASAVLTSATTWVTGTFIPAMTTAISRIPSILATAVRLLPWAAVISAIVGAIALAITDKDFTDIGYEIGHSLGTALKNIGEWLGTAGEWIVSIGGAFLDGINAAWEWVKEEFDIENVFELIAIMFNPVSWVTKIVPKVIEIGAEVLPGLWQGIEDGWDNFWGNVEEFIDGFVKGFKDALGIHSPSTVFAEIGKYIIEGLLNGITDKWKALKRWYNTTVAPKLTLSYWLNAFSNLKTGFTQTIKNAVNAGIDMMNRFIGWLNTKLNFSWDALSIAGKEVFPAGSIQLFTIPTIPRLEKGGFLEDGLFTMNHGEIAGRFNNGKSVVANNQQIVEGIAAGVYEAVVRAMNDANGRQDQNVNVYLDGKQIYASVKKTESERGRALMGNQLGYAY